ncbi:hypothetical protein J4H86_12370 [Spiractinospora alimapuensis]|uniref:hypothetical protein n=1 Tax=Spiractinospora alimapuensis TaxID=2820884 RepID=UPI001F4536D7|nr:hypothetical protein [Spiractinospora alimapuensis]QVQ54395.1 hypothetical protein J4H86_12370 [Spiractinospora alimapuensis]
MRFQARRVLACSTAVPVAALMAWLIVAFGLLLVGNFHPLLAALLGIPVIGIVVWFVCGAVPTLRRPAPRWSIAAVGGIALASTVVQSVMRAEELVVRRDAGSYAQYTAWIAQHGSLPIPQGRELLAGDLPGLSYASLAFYQVGEEIWPQFLAGAPLVYAPGFWLGGLPGMLLVPPIVGGLSVLTFAGLTARLVGPAWAPLGALLLAVCLPQQWVTRATYSEPVAQLLMLGGLLLAHDAWRRYRDLPPVDAATRRTPRLPSGVAGLAALAGLALGLAMVVRVDALRDLLPVLVFAGIALAVGQRPAFPLLTGLILGAGAGFAAAYVLSRPYIDYLADSYVPQLVVSAIVVFLTLIGALALRRFGPPPRPDWLPTLAPALVCAVALGLAARPLFVTQRGHGSEVTDNYVAWVQEQEGVPIDPSRTYEEASLEWVGWYLGVATVIFAVLGAGVLARRVLLPAHHPEAAPEWILPLMVLLWGTALVLLRPAITPDHPWASRRLVVVVLPAVVLLAVWAVAWLSRRLRERSLRRGVMVGVSAAGLLLPTVATSQVMFTYRGDAGTVEQVDHLCDALPQDASVLIPDASTMNNFGQLIRGMCGVPTALMDEPDRALFVAATTGIRDRDRVPVLISGELEDMLPYLVGESWPDVAFTLNTEQDPSTLTHPPDGPWRFTSTLYIATDPEADS